MKLTGKKKFGYALGIFTESLLYNMYYTYFLTFLIEIVKVKPSYASIVIFISIAWDAITDPIIGNYADRPGVDKKKMMKYSVLPLAVFFIVAWTTIGAGFTTQIAKILTYTFISLLIWIFYTTYSIPYYAIVPELTEDYDERTKIRSLSSILNAICVGLGNILPALVPTVAIIVGEKLQSNAYAFVAAIISVLAIVCGFVCCKSLNGVYTPKGEKQKVKMPGVKETFKSYGEIIKLKLSVQGLQLKLQRFLHTRLFLCLFGYSTPPIQSPIMQLYLSLLRIMMKGQKSDHFHQYLMQFA